MKTLRCKLGSFLVWISGGRLSYSFSSKGKLQVLWKVQKNRIPMSVDDHVTGQFVEITSFRHIFEI